MDKRKGIILAVIIFLLIGLGTFVFANPSEDSLKGNDNSTDKSSDTKEEDLDNENTNDGLEEEGEEEENKPNTNGTTNVVIGGTDDSTGSNENDSVDDEEQNNGDDLTGDEDEDTPSKPSLPEVDKTAPIVVINDKEYQGLDNSAGYLSTEVVLTLAEEDLIVTIIKDGEKVEFIDGMSLSVDGNYTLSVKDEAGNETVVEFSIDKTKPVYTALGLLNLTHYNEKGDVTVANIGDKIRIFVQFDEELAVNPQVTFGDGTAVKMNLTSNEAFDKYTYYVDVTLTKEMNLADGNITFKVFGYSDAAKNPGDELTESNIKTNDNITYEGVRLDTTDPIIKLFADNGKELKNGVFTAKTVKVVVEGEESYTAKLLQNENEIEFVENKFYDNGNYELTVTDAAGNSSTIKFNVDKTKPAFYINGKKQDNSKDLGYFNKEDGEVSVKLVISNLKEAYVTKDGVKLDIDLTNEFKLSEDGKYVLYALNKAGTKTEITFEIDTTDPIIKLFADNGKELKNGVFTAKTVKVVVEGEESYTAKLLQNENEIEFVENKFYDNGNYELTVTDAAGNSSTIKFNVDKTKPAFYINGKKQDNSKDLGYFNKEDGEVTVKLVESNLKEAYVTKDGVKLDIDLTKDFKLSEDGKYVLYAIDKAGTKTEVTFEIDTISPERGYSTLGFEYTDSKDKEYVENNRNKYYYVKENDSFLYKIAFNEQIQDGLIATIGGKEIQLSYLDYSKDLGYIYGAEYVVPSGLEENSQLEIIISNIKDLAGNEYDNKIIIDVPTSNDRVAIYDSEDPKINVYKWPKKDYPNALKESTFNYCVVAEASDISGLSSFTIDGKDYTPGENAHICDDGEHVFTAIDKAGNVDTFEFNIDRTYGAVTINNKDVYNTHDLENTHYYNEITSVTFSEEGTVRLTKDGSEVYYGSREEFNYEFIDGVYKFELFDKGGNPTAFMFKVDSIDPTATIEYSIEDRTNQKVIATLKPSEEVTITNNEGKDTYTFNENGSFTFKFEDKAGNKGTATAAVNWINKEIPTVKEIKYVTDASNNSITVTTTLSKPIYTPSGWTMDGKAYVFKKLYNTNTNENVKIKDLYGNTNSFEIDVNWLETTNPTVKEIEYITNLSNNSVTVRATLSKPIYTPSGWTMDGKAYVFKKEYNANINETVEIKDLSNATNNFNVNISWLKNN